MTRRIEFAIITSRLIRLQDKIEETSMQHIDTFKVKASNNEDLSSF